MDYHSEARGNETVIIDSKTGDIIATVHRVGSQSPEQHTAIATALTAAPAMVSAIQWLLTEMRDAGETHGPGGDIYGCVEEAAATVAEAGGALSWFSVEDAVAYRAREAAERAALLAAADGQG